MRPKRFKVLFTIIAVYSASTFVYFCATHFSGAFRKIAPWTCFSNAHVKFHASGYIDTTSTWRTLSLTTYVFTAYLDDREPRSTVISVFGFGEKKEFPFDGTLSLHNGSMIALGKYKKRMLLNPFGVYNLERLGPFLYIWPLPDELKYTGTNFTATNLRSIVIHRTNRSKVKMKADIPITFPEYSTKTFGVCIDSPLYGSLKPQTIIENIEINKILGAEFFTFYIYNADQKTLQVLQEYAREGTVEVVLNWRHDSLGQFTHYFGQTMSINECAYRNMHRVKYLVYTDLDEFIVPKKSLGWASMMAEIANVKFGTYLFQHAYFFDDSNDTDIDKSVNKLQFNCYGSHQLDLPRFLTRKVRSRHIHRPGVRSKYITMPLYTSAVGVHIVFNHRDKMKTYVVPSDLALLHHYRRTVVDRKLRERVPDNRTSVVYKEKIVAAMKKKLCRFVRLGNGP